MMRNRPKRVLRTAAIASLAFAAACTPAEQKQFNGDLQGVFSPNPRTVMDQNGRPVPFTSESQVDASGYSLAGVPLVKATVATTGTAIFQGFEGKSAGAILSGGTTESKGAAKDAFRPDSAPADLGLLGSPAGWNTPVWGPRPVGLQPRESQLAAGGLRQAAAWTAVLPKTTFPLGADKQPVTSACAAIRDYTGRVAFAQAVSGGPGVEAGRGALYRFNSRAQVCVAGGTVEQAKAMAEKAIVEIPVVARGLRGSLQ